MDGWVKVEEFKLSTLAALEKINLDPVFDFSQADEEAKKLIVQTFNHEEQGKELSIILSNAKQSDHLIYDKKGVFEHRIHDGELSTSKVGTNAIEFCKALIHFIREQLKDLETQETFIPISLKWHVGVAIFIQDDNNSGDSIIYSEPGDAEWASLESDLLDKEWKEWGEAEYKNKDDFVDAFDWTEHEVNCRNAWQNQEIIRITTDLKSNK